MSKSSYLSNRKSTLQNAAIKDYIHIYYEVEQPEFTDEDEKNKQKIFNNA